MIETILDAKAALEAEGLFVTVNNLSSLLIGGVVSEDDEGLRLFRDACTLNYRAGKWIAVLPAEGLLTYEIPGSLAESVSLILTAYQHHRRTGGEFNNTFKHLVKDPEQYLIGRSLAGVSNQAG